MRSHTRHSIRPSLENLEARDNPAGTVTATFIAGSLTLTGDAADNTVLISPGENGLLTISGDGSGTVVRLNGGPAGEEVALPAPLTGAVTINLGDGADTLTLEALDVPGSLSINGGNGAIGDPAGNGIALRDGVLVGGNLTITNLAGADVISLSGLVDVGGAMTIRNGSGGSLVSVVPNTVDLRVGGLLSITGGAGFDKVDMWDSMNVSVGGIAFNSGLDAGGSYFRIHALEDLTVAGSVRLTNGGGEHYNYLGVGGTLAVGGAVVIHNGDGKSLNTLLAWGTLSPGRVAITNGAGYHDNTIHSYDKTVIRGGVSIANGAGDSINTIQGNSILSVGGNISFVNGLGRDLNSIAGGDAQVAGSITIRNGNGDSETTVTADTALSVGGPTRVTAGDGKDLVFIGTGRNDGDPMPAADLGPVTVNVGDGGSEIAVVGSRLNVRGSVNISAWDGTDQVALASGTDNGSVAGNVFFDIGPGDDQIAAVGTANGHVLTIGGALGIWTDSSAGATQVGLAGLNVRSWTEIWTGDGEDQVMITGSTFGGEFDLDTGAGGDIVQLEPNAHVTNFRGPVWVNLGDGDDQVWLGGDPDLGGQVVFAGSTEWQGGAGWDGLLGRNFGAIFYGPEPEMTGFDAYV